MNIAYITSEVFPFSKTGGLADIAYFLPKAINEKKIKTTVITPYYKQISKFHNEMTEIGKSTISMGGIETIVNFFLLTKEKVDYVFVQNMHYFEREQFYGYNDDAERFTCFSYAALDVLVYLDKFPDILHINDWQTGMIPYLLDTHYRKMKQYKNLPTILTIHNLEYQGNFDPYVSRFFNSGIDYTYNHFNRVNFLKAGIEKATLINTVSPNYRNEILTRNFGFTLDGTLNNRKNDLYGILNGIDYDTFNPETDPYIISYNFKTFQNGKILNKRKLYESFMLGNQYHQPLVSYIGRYANQKGLWMIKETIEDIINNTYAKFFFLGSGDKEYEHFFKYLTDKYPGRVGNYIGFNEELAHQIYASSDIFLMPSEFEPCGLGQMISMKYGTLPIVRETGGLKDTVIAYNKFTKEGTGFRFTNLNSFELKEKIFEAIYLYQTDQLTWKKLVNQAMNTNYSNEKMADEYIKLYKKMLGEE